MKAPLANPQRSLAVCNGTGAFIHHLDWGFARLNFATPAAILKEVVTRMGEAVRRR
jgi:bifunctional pyridoxal-dependent enzyme with beta-cystathionase and maltose regulon repressor activities